MVKGESLTGRTFTVGYGAGLPINVLSGKTNSKRNTTSQERISDLQNGRPIKTSIK